MSSNEPRKRLKAAESRRALLDAGLELLQSRGVAPGLDRVTLKDAIELSGVPRSTAYRLYEGGKGQLEEYRADLLHDLDNSVGTAPTAAEIEQILASVAPLIESQDPLKMAVALREIVRVTVNANVESVVNSLEWRVYMSSLASLGTGLEVDAAVTETFRLAAEQFGERFVALFTQLSSVFGLRARDSFTLRDLGAMVSATIEGTALRQHVEPRLSDMKRNTGVNGEPQSWTAAAVTVEGLVVTWFERDKHAKVSADLGSWTSWS